MGIFMLAASNPAHAEPAAATAAASTQTAAASPVTSTAAPAAGPATVYLANGQAVQAAAAVANVSTPASAITRAPLMLATLPLTALVAAFSAGEALDQQTDCLATTVYFEARGESLEGQLAVANVVINRARSGKYPPTWCEVMKQPWQFSFVNPRTGRYPSINYSSHAWTRAQAIARIAAQNVAAQVAPDVLWYHADYVAPSWGRRLKRAEKIGTHIFYRA